VVRRSALPDAVASGEVHARAAKCGICDASTPRFLCPSCPRRNAGQKSEDGHGWETLRKAWREFPDMADCLRQAAELGRAVALTHESHPGFARLERAYQDNGIRLGQLRQQHREMLAAKHARPRP
jgi:hypothetical protein